MTLTKALNRIAATTTWVSEGHTVQTYVYVGYTQYDFYYGTSYWIDEGSRYVTQWVDTSHNVTTPEVRSDGGSDVLSFGAGISASDLQIAMSGNDLIVGVRDPANPNATFAQLTDKITLQNWTDPLNQVETFKFADGSTLNVDSISSFQSDTSNTDTLSGSTGNDWISGDAGNDSISGHGGNDILIGGLGMTPFPVEQETTDWLEVRLATRTCLTVVIKAIEFQTASLATVGQAESSISVRTSRAVSSGLRSRITTCAFRSWARRTMSPSITSTHRVWHSFRKSNYQTDYCSIAVLHSWFRPW